MIAGFKTGPKNWEEGKQVVEEDDARMCEVWFDVTNAQKYNEMLQWFGERGVKIGLHHWGLVDGQYKTNISAADDAIRSETIRQVKETIDIGAGINCAYVNIHPGARAIERMNFTSETQELVSMEPSNEEASAIFLESAGLLHRYAQSKNVLLTIETLPARESRLYTSRKETYDAGNIPLETLRIFARRGGYLANDITHTAGQFALESPSREEMWRGLLSFTTQCAESTKLIHVNTVTPPFNGTDSHDGITDQDFARNVFPSRDQLEELLAIFKDREDVYAVLEPREDMQDNYRALRRLLDRYS